MPIAQPHFNSMLLEIHVPDFDAIKNFYGRLGFEIVWERKPDGFKGYLVMKKEDNILCFWGGNEHIYEQDYFRKFSQNTPRGYGIEIVIMVKDIKEFYEETRKSFEIFEDLQLRPWGLEDFRLVDPFGYYLRFTSYHNILDPKNAVA